MITHISNRKIWSIAFPIILGSIAQNFINVTDTAFLGRLGEIELGASAIGGVFYLTVVMFGYGLGLGTQIIVARRAGESREVRIGTVVEHSMATLILSSLVILIFIRLFSTSFFSLVISSPSIFMATDEFMAYRAWGVIFAFINMGFNAFYIGTGRTRIVTWSTLLMAVVNIFMDWLLIFGNLGMPELGIRGAAIASVCAEFSVTLFLVIYAKTDPGNRLYGFFQIRRPDYELWLRMLKISFPLMLQNVISLAVWFAFFVFVEKMGETDLAASNIIRSVYVILMIPIWGFSAASNTLVSFLIGRRREDDVMNVVYKISRLCLLMVLAFIFAGLMVPGKVIGIYTGDPMLIERAIPVLYVVNVSVLGFAYAMVFLSAVSGTGKTMVALRIELMVIGVYLIAAYSFSNIFRFPVYIVWSVEFLYAFLIFFLSFLYLKSGRWKEGLNRL